MKFKITFLCLILLSQAAFTQSSLDKVTLTYLKQLKNVNALKIMVELENTYILDKETKGLKQLLLGEWNVVTTNNGRMQKQRYKFSDTGQLEIYEHDKKLAYILEWDITPFHENECCFEKPLPEFLFWLRRLSYYEYKQENREHEWWALPVREITNSTFQIDSTMGKKIN